MEQGDKLTLEECRQILGADAEGWPDDKIERLRDRLEALAHELYPVIGERAAQDLEGLREAACAHRYGIDETDLIVDPTSTMRTTKTLPRMAHAQCSDLLPHQRRKTGRQYQPG